MLCAVLLTAFPFCAVHGQQPDKPRLVRVTVDPETGSDMIYWEPSPTPGVDYYVIGRVVRPNPLEPWALVQVGTADASATSFENPNTTSDEESIGYTVWAVDEPVPGSLFSSLYDEPDSTLFAGAVFDSCRATLSVTWNDYNSWRGQIRNYTVYQRLDNGLYVALATLPEGTNQYTLGGVMENYPYRIFIEASHSDGIRLSTSNRIDIVTDMSVVPDYIYADFATLGADGGIDLSFSIDPASELQTYKLLRSSAPDGSFDTITTIQTSAKSLSYHDEVPFVSGRYYYRLMAFNNCGRPALASNLASNVLLGGTYSNLLVNLSWNEYLQWGDGVDHYQVTRETGFRYPLADSFSVGTDTWFRDDFSTRINYNDPQSTRICYRITAFESSAGSATPNTSRSNLLCFSLEPDVRMPNAFIPNSQDGVNNTFRPVFSFVPERYEMTIFNRSGLKIWEGSGPWDGRVNGKMVNEGVYLYHLVVYNFSGTGRERTGTVTVVYQ